MHFRWLILLLLLSACRGDAITNCGEEPDVTGAWQLTLSPAPPDLGAAASITDTIEVDAELEQAGKTDVFGIGHYVYGTLTASDLDYFSTLTIPRLLQNDGAKTGAVLGCTLRINVPITASVTDDNVDQGPLRIALAGQVTMKGVLTGIEGSQLVMESDTSKTVRAFSWAGRRR